MRYGTWRGLPQYVDGVKKFDYGRAVAVRAVFVHIMEGVLWGTDDWFHDAASGTTSTHFGIGYASSLDRLLKRVSVYQWVDTRDTAYGTAVTRWPVSALAQQVLLDLIGRIDVNHAIIHIEVEGYGDEPWPIGFVRALNYLLAAIGSFHGPIIVMRHNDVSSKPCPGYGTPWPIISPTYGQPLATLPDTAVPVVDPDVAILKRIVRNTTKRVRLRGGITIWDSPDKSQKALYQVDMAGETWEIIGSVSDGRSTNGTTVWRAVRRPFESTKGIFFCHETAVDE